VKKREFSAPNICPFQPMRHLALPGSAQALCVCFGHWGRAGGAAIYGAAPICTLDGRPVYRLLPSRGWGGAGLVTFGQTFVFGGQDTPAACTNPGKVLLWRGGCLWRSRVLALSFFLRSEIFPLLRKHKKQPAKHGIVCLLSFAGAVGGAVFINFG
jgi:hypothetical protein